MFRKNLSIITKVILICILSLMFMTQITYHCYASTKKVQKANALMEAGQYYDSFKIISKISVGKKGYKEAQELLVELKEKAFPYYEGEINNKINEKAYIEGVKLSEEALLIMPENEKITNLKNNAKNLLFKVIMLEANGLYKEKKYEEAITRLEEIKYLYPDSKELEKKLSTIQFSLVKSKVNKNATMREVYKKFDEYDGEYIHWPGQVSTIDESGGKTWMILVTEESGNIFSYTVHFDNAMEGVYEDHYVEVWGQIKGTERLQNSLTGEEIDAPKVIASFCKW